MPLVTKIQQIRANISVVDAALAAPASNEHRAYVELIHRGRCLVPYVHEGELRFVPSRFVGYEGNSLPVHLSEDRDGRESNVAVSKVLGVPLVEDLEMDAAFVDYCRRIRGDLPLKVPTISRKYWMTEDAVRCLTEGQVAAIQNDPTIPETTRKALIDARVGQGKFRRQLEDYWGRRCAVTGVGPVAILKASHIYPWRSCDNLQRLDVHNGLLLAPNLDSLFDRGYITFAANGEMLVSRELKSSERNVLLPQDSSPLKLAPEHQKYMELHRKHVFLQD